MSVSSGDLMAPNIPLSDKVNGYPKLACQMELWPELALFRRFGALNAENMLYLQAELSWLEIELQKQQLADNRSGDPRKMKYARNWYHLSSSAENGDPSQLNIVLKIRETLRLYNEALIQNSQIITYPEPMRRDLDHVQRLLHLTNPPLLGRDATTWGSISTPQLHSHDLITLCPRQKEDPFSGWVFEKAIARFLDSKYAQFKEPSKHGIIGFKDNTVLRICGWVTSIVASLIPISSIAILYTVRSMPARLGIIAAFSVLITICVLSFSKPKRSELFAITAAFAAVQVVFVSTDRD